MSLSNEKLIAIKENIPDIDIEGSVNAYTGSEDFYLELLDDWCNAGRAENMKKAFDADDMATYRIEAHSLKGTSRMIGLESIAKLGEDLQFACDKGDYDFVKANHAHAIEVLESTITLIKMLMD